MAKRHTALFTELTDASTRIMVALTGQDKMHFIKESVFLSINSQIRAFHCESGGIVGFDQNGVIAAFQYDNVQSPKLYEYYPNTTFLNEVINGRWMDNEISFAGFVHSHLHNNQISPQDISYCREILNLNSFMEFVLAGIIDLSSKTDSVKWYEVLEDSVNECEIQILD